MPTRRHFSLPSLLALLLAGSSAAAADIALVLTDSSAVFGAARGHETRVQVYSDTGYEVLEGLDLDRAEAAGLIREFAAALEEADRVLIHLTGRIETAGGVSVFLPEGVEPDGSAAMLVDGLPLAAFAALAAERPGEAMVALGRAAAPGAEELAIDLPEGVLLLRGDPGAVSSVATGVLVAAGLPPTAIDAAAAGVVFEGEVSERMRFGRVPGGGSAGGGIYVPPAPTDPRQIEDALDLTRDERRGIQRDLTALGFDTRGIDGVFGAGTRSAIRDWERSADFAPNGYLTAQEIDRLSSDAEEARAEAARREAADRDAWNRASTTDSIAAYRAYLERYPEGLYATRARERIAALENERADERAWERARSADTIEGYRRYLRDFPDGSHVREARDRLRALGGEPPVSDRQLWTSAREKDTVAAYRAYLDAYPRGEYADAARRRIAELEGAAGSEERARREENAQGLNPASILLIEARMALLGYDPGVVDGQIDSSTRAALRRYQSANRLPVTGYFDNATMQKLNGGR